MIRQPTRTTRTYTLFPFTTLVRSRWMASFFLLAGAIVPVRDMVRGKVGFATRRCTARPSLLDDLRFGDRQHFGVFDPPPRAEQRVSQDRKSTRLNSSH